MIETEVIDYASWHMHDPNDFFCANGALDEEFVHDLFFVCLREVDAKFAVSPPESCQINLQFPSFAFLINWHSEGLYLIVTDTVPRNEECEELFRSHFPDVSASLHA